MQSMGLTERRTLESHLGSCDGMLNWDEFKEMFFRVRQDKTGWEPRRLFNTIEVHLARHAGKNGHPAGCSCDAFTTIRYEGRHTKRALLVSRCRSS